MLEIRKRNTPELVVKHASVGNAKKLLLSRWLATPFQHFPTAIL